MGTALARAHKQVKQRIQGLDGSSIRAKIALHVLHLKKCRGISLGCFWARTNRMTSWLRQKEKNHLGERGVLRLQNPLVFINPNKGLTGQGFQFWDSPCYQVIHLVMCKTTLRVRLGKGKAQIEILRLNRCTEWGSDASHPLNKGLWSWEAMGLWKRMANA